MPALVDEIVEARGPVDILLHNADVSHSADAGGHAIRDWRRVTDSNVNSISFLSQGIARRCMIPPVTFLVAP